MSSYTITDEKSFSFPQDKVLAAIQAAAAGLEGKIIHQEGPEVHIKFNKTIHGQVLGDRSVIEVTMQDAGDGTSLAVEAYPIDPVGQKLKFGARKGVTQKVLSWFWAHIEHNLAK